MGSEFRLDTDQSQESGSVEREAHKEGRGSNYQVLVLSPSRADKVRTKGGVAKALLSLLYVIHSTLGLSVFLMV